MIAFLEKLKNISIVTIVAAIVIGIILMMRPIEAMSFVAIATGITLLVLGAAAWIEYVMKNKSVFLAVLGGISAVLGIIVCARYKAIITIFLVLLGFFLIVSGIIDLISSVTIKPFFGVGWLFSLFTAIAVIVLGTVIVVNPFQSAVVGARVLGISLFIYAMLDIVLFFQVRKTVTLKKVVDKDVAEIDITPEDIE